MSTNTAPQPRLETASWLRRIVALAIDWVACVLVTLALVGPDRYFNDQAANAMPLFVFLLESGLGTALVGGSFGQIIARIRVLRTNGRPLSLLASLFRSLLVCLVVPPLVFRPDGRGLHDLWTDSAAYRLPR